MPRQSQSISKEGIGWQYCTMIDRDRRKTKCNFCGKQMHGDGITRLKHHIAGGQLQGISHYNKVSPQIKRQMQDHLVKKEVGERKRLIRMQH